MVFEWVFVKKCYLVRSNKVVFYYCLFLLVVIECFLLKWWRLGIISRFVYFFDFLWGFLYVKFRNFLERENIKDIVNIMDIVNLDFC